MEHEVSGSVYWKKRRISPEQRMAAKSLLIAHFPELLSGGQLIIHFGPGRSPQFIEVQERRNEVSKNVVDKVA